jgi:hypothetical protein
MSAYKLSISELVAWRLSRIVLEPVYTKYHSVAPPNSAEMAPAETRVGSTLVDTAWNTVSLSVVLQTFTSVCPSASATCNGVFPCPSRLQGNSPGLEYKGVYHLLILALMPFGPCSTHALTSSAIPSSVTRYLQRCTIFPRISRFFISAPNSNKRLTTSALRAVWSDVRPKWPRAAMSTPYCRTICMAAVLLRMAYQRSS